MLGEKLKVKLKGDTLKAAVTHVFSFFLTFCCLDPKKGGRKIVVMHKKFSSQHFLQPQSAFSIFSLWVKMGGGLMRSPGRVPIVQDPLKPLVLGFVCRKEHLPREDVWGDKGFPTWCTHMINAAAAQSGDDSPRRQCTEMMSHVRVSQACTCGVPNVVKNFRGGEWNPERAWFWHAPRVWSPWRVLFQLSVR